MSNQLKQINMVFKGTCFFLFFFYPSPWAYAMLGRPMDRINRELMQYKVMVVITVTGRLGLEPVTFCTTQARTDAPINRATSLLSDD